MSSFFLTLGIRDIWQLILATTVFLMLPGPGTFCVLTCTAKGGIRSGFFSLFGLMLGDITLMLLAAMGVAALLQANPLLFKGMQYLGALYLAYLGINLLRSRNTNKKVIPFSHMADFRRGLFVTLINPKAIVFYMAFFPLFIDEANHHGSVTFITMGAIISCCTLSYGTLLVLLGNAVAKRLSSNQGVVSFATKAAGIFLIGFGVKLSTQ